MRIVELHDIKDPGLDYDIVDDTIVYMRNDPMFYRKHYFPAMSKLADLHSSGGKIDPRKHLMPTIEAGCNEYVKKYKVARNPEEVYSNEARNSILEKIYSEELELIRKGEYK